MTGLVVLQDSSTVATRALEMVTPVSAAPMHFAISPDGTMLVFSAYDGGISKLWLRSLENDEAAEPMGGTENALNPFWSADSTSVGWTAGVELKTIAVESGAVQTLSVGITDRATWNSENTLVFPGSDGLWRIASSGGPAEPLLIETPGVPFHPSFLPDGQHFLFYVQGPEGGVFVGRLGDRETRFLVSADSAAAFVRPDTLLFVREGILFAQGFDPDRVEMVGATPDIVATDLITRTGFGISASETGTVVYRKVGAAINSEFVWMDRSGNLGERFTIQNGHDAAALELSADDLTVAYELDAFSDDSTSIWKVGLGRGEQTQVTDSPGIDAQPSWSPDGRRIAFFRLAGKADIFITGSDGSSAAELFLESPERDFMNDWSADGEHLLFHRDSSSIWTVSADGGQSPEVFVDTVANEAYGQFSPDGNWVAYESDDLGRIDIYVRPFPPRPGQGTIVSSDGGGAQVRWGPRGDEIFYVSLDGGLMSAPIQLPSDGGQPVVGTPVELFRAPVGTVQYRGQQYDVSADGERFLMNTLAEPSSYLTVILDFRRGQSQ